MRNATWWTKTLVILLSLGLLAADDATPVPDGWIDTLQWRSIGPANMGGRIVDIAVYEQDPCIWYVATASGGLLKTTNNGISFEHQFQHEATISLGSVAVAASNPEIVWVGTGESNPRNSVSWGNGVYKSVDGGKTWTHMGLDETFQTGRIHIHPDDPDIVYVGALGRLWGPNEQRGLFKTIDGGETWEKILYVDENTGVVDLTMHPTEPETLIVATYERQRDGFDTNDPSKKWGPGSGLWKTTDGGKTFMRLEKGLPSAQLGRIGLDWYRADPNYVYAVIESEKIGGEPENAPFMGVRGQDADVGARLVEVTADGPADGAGLKEGDIVVAIGDQTVHSNADMLRLMRSHVAGETVKVEVSRERKSVVVDVTFDRKPGAEEDPDAGDGRFRGRRRSSGPFQQSLGGQRENMQDQQGPDGHEYGGVYRSADAGDTWERINSVNPRPMYYSQIRVDPSNNSYIYVLGTSLYRSSDGGVTFTGDGARGGVHVDHHAMWINPNDGRHIVLGNDGGIYVTCDRMERWDHLNHMALGQFYHVTVGPRKNYMVYGGLQDNGSWGGPSRSRSGAGPINEDWIRIGGGDGFLCLVDPNDPDQLFFESQNGATGRRNLRTGERGFIRPRAPRGQRYRFNWRTPFILSHHNSGIYYSAGNHVFRSLWRGDDIKSISPEITKTDRGSATALAESPLDGDVLYAGTDDGALWMTRDGGAEWTDLYSITAEDLAAKPEADAEGESDAPAAPAGAEGRGERRGPGGRRGGRMLEMLREADANGDGKIQRSEVPERASGMFDRVDGNSDGVIDQAEIKAVADRFGGGGEATGGERRSDAPASSGRSGRRGGRMTGQLIEADANDDGKIEKSEAPAQLWALFDRLDEDDDGVLLVADLEAPPAGAGEQAEAAEATAETSEAAPPVASEATEEAAAPPATEAGEETPAADDPVTGVWDAKATAENMPPDAGRITLTLALAADGTVTGRLSSQFNDGEIIPGKFDRENGRLTFGFEGEQMGFDINATVKGSSMNGTIDIGEGMFSMEFTAKRTATEAPADEAVAEETVDDGYDWKPIVELVPDPRWVSCLETSRASASRVYLTFDGHRSDDDEPHVFVSENHGRSWRSIRANLPTSAGTTRVIREDLTNPEILYLGTEFGAWVSIDRGASWQSLNTNLPTVAIHELAQHPTAGEMAAATHGRSIWILDVTPIRQMTGATVASDAHLYRPSAVTYWRTEPGRGGDLRRFVGSNRAERADIYYSLNGNARRVRLHIEDAAGEAVATLEPETGSGLHRVSWNMQRQVEDDGQQRRRRGRAPRVAPGTYTIVLEVNGEDHRQPLEVTGDPEFPEAVLWGEEYERQLEIERELMSGDDDEEGQA